MNAKIEWLKVWMNFREVDGLLLCCGSISVKNLVYKNKGKQYT